MAFKVTSEECTSAAQSLENSAKKIEELVNTFDEELQSVQLNYESQASSDIAESYNKVKEFIPEFKAAISECSKYLINTVAPAYQKVEQDAQSKVNG